MAIINVAYIFPDNFFFVSVRRLNMHNNGFMQLTSPLASMNANKKSSFRTDIDR